MLPGPIHGGLSKIEMRRRRGELIINPEPEPKKSVAQEVREKIEVVKKDLNKSQMVPAVPDKPKGPGVLEKVKGAFKFIRDVQSEWQKTKPKEEPKPTPAPVAPVTAMQALREIQMAPPSRPAPGAAAKVTTPQVGERWTVGPCIVCKHQGKRTGVVVTSPSTSIRRFLWINDGLDRVYGCGLCAKRA